MAGRDLGRGRGGRRSGGGNRYRSDWSRGGKVGEGGALAPGEPGRVRAGRKPTRGADVTPLDPPAMRDGPTAKRGSLRKDDHPRLTATTGTLTSFVLPLPVRTGMKVSLMYS